MEGLCNYLKNIETDTKKSFWYSIVNQVECWSHVDQQKINYLILLRLKAPAADSTPAASTMLRLKATHGRPLIYSTYDKNVEFNPE